MAKPTVQRFMSAKPAVIESRRTLADAHRRMRELRVRHLPVVDDGKLVGIVSQRDLYMLETVRGVDAELDTVADAMASDPYTAPPDRPLDLVAREMAEHKYGAAVVVDGGAVVGVFTTVDALRALGEVLGRVGAAHPPRDARAARKPSGRSRASGA